ncbi:hypothetical protein F4604DRAFT_1765091 [Suillus subluteus]|nr:hypothetical protein F4604DRAFT_1765091 [Suillus subluteus]
MSVASESPQTDVLEYIITHIFCPIKLPQHSDYTLENDRSLLDVVLGSARKFVSSLPDHDQEHWCPSLKMLENLAVTMTSPSLTGDVVGSQIKSMQAGDILAYLIREQNAAVVLRKLDTKTIFESFEVSPPASAIMQAKGKLLCSYPGPAIAVPNSVVDNPTFPPELVNFLSHMSSDGLDPSVPKGETAHPRYITQLLTDILCAFGEPADIPRIRKRICDDALQSNPMPPWRRSSIWLVIRVVLQTSLERTSLGRNSYKAFMASLMTDLVSKALEGDMSSDLLYSMSIKISRRLVKLQAEDEFLAIAMHKATEDIKDRLELRWKNVQVAQADSPHWDASKVHIIRDTRLSLTESKKYISSILHPTHVQRNVQDFEPHHRPRGTIDDFLGPDANFFESAYAEDPFVALSDFECTIERDIDGWVNRVMNLDAAHIDAACMAIQARAKSYSTRAQSFYSGNPENISIMLLTLFELWVALDKLVVESIPLLMEYSPEVPVAIFDHLLLQKAAAIERLRVLQQYVAGRHTHNALSVFSDGADMSTFAVRYYNQSEELQSCKQRIEDDANAERKKRIADLRGKSDRYRCFTKEIDALTCDYYTNWRGWSQHDRDCRRCEKQKERDNLSVEVHEWPLPDSVYDAAVVVFELSAPIAFKMWRSFTFYFLYDICTPTSPQIQHAGQYIQLACYGPLSRHHAEHPGQRITLASMTALPRTSPKSLPCTESDIFINTINQLYFRLYDMTCDVWASSSFRQADISDICTHVLPKGPYHGLQYYLSGTQHTSNEVLANQATCHAELTLHEFIAFGSLRSGSLLQWINILRELRARTLTFRDPAVHLLLLQASLEVGELSADGSRAWHNELKSSEFGHALIDELQSLKVSVEANWLEGTTMSTISVLVSRLLSSAEDFSVIQRSCKLLQAVRNTTFRWVQELSKADAPDEKSTRERQVRVRDMAATCLSTYDVGPDNIAALLQSPQDLEILVYCSVTVMDNVPPDLHSLPIIPRLLLERNRRLSHFLETYFRRHVEDDQEGLDRAMERLWPAYQRHTPWEVLESPNSRWLRCETAPFDDSSRQTVHLDMLTARLLVDGKPLTRLPDCFLRHPSYITLFGHQVFDVFPTKIHGMEFVAKAVIHHFKIFFGMRSGDVVIQSQHEKGYFLELIPPGNLELDIPALLVQDHVHWLNLRTRAIEFRPMERLWEPSRENWVLKFTEDGQSVARQGQTTLFDIRSRTFCMIANTLGPLENSQYLIVTSSRDEVKVDLPRFGLSFFIDKDGELHSRNQRGMVVDKDQSTGTMIGLVNQLVLRPKDRQTYSDRRVIIPQGDVVVEPSGHHVRANIHTGPDDVRRNVGLTNKLYKVYLHAVCSAHVPDPLTRRTGLEEAMYLLQSAACFSFMKLDPFDCKLLARIASLTVDRIWSTARERSQEVRWQLGLSSYVQSCAFYHAVRDIVQYAQKLQVLSETPVSVCPDFPVRNEFLLERASQRSTFLYSRDPVNSFYPSKSSSSEYTSRDVYCCSIDDQNAFDCARMVRDWSVTLEPCQSLYDVFVQWNEVSGKIRGVSLRYDREWLKPDLAKRWMSVYELCCDADQETHTFQLAFTLPAMAYSSPENVGLAATMFAFAAIPEFRAICSPGYDIYDLSFGIKPLEHDLCHHISSHATFHRSPEASWSSHDNESSHDFNNRRQRHFQSECLREQKAAVGILLDCWPRDSVPAHALQCLSGSRYDKLALCAALEKQYSNCYRNRCLKVYLDRVQNVLDEARRTFMPSIKQSYTFTPSNSDIILVNTTVLTQDLFRKPPPVIKLLPDPLKRSNTLLSGRSLGGGLDPSLLEDVISKFSQCRSDQFSVHYAEHLEDSRIDLENEQSPIVPDPTRWTVDMLQHHHMWCNRLYDNAFRRLEEHLAPAGLAEESLFNSGQWPRITVTFLLGLLASTSKTPLCDSWKAPLTGFAHILLRLQRSQRLLKLKLAAGGDNGEFLKEMVNDGHLGVNGTQKYLDWLLIQAENRFLIRPMQASVAMEMISPSSGNNTTLQLHMGEGKSSVIVPVCCAALADRSNLVRVVVLKPLAVQMFQLLVERIGGLTNRRIFYLPFSRSLPITPDHANIIQSLFEECKAVGGILVAQPDHILSFKLMTVEQQLPPTNAVGQSSLATPLLNTQRWLDMHTRDILDESDELLHVRFQLVYTMGDQQHLEDYPDRWTTTQQVMTLVAKHARLVHQEFPLGVEFQSDATATFPLRVLDVRAGERLVGLVCDDILAGNLPNFAFGHVPRHMIDSIREYLTLSIIDPQLLRNVRNYCAGSSLWNGLLLIRGLLAHGILIYTMKDRRWRVDYGLDPRRTMLAVPYRAKDVPSSRAEFGHPDIAVALTCLSYYYKGLTEKQVALCFRQLLKQDNPALEYETWIKGLSSDSLPDNLQRLSGINMKSTEQFTNCLVPLFRCNKAVVDFFLAQFVLPKEAKEFPHKLSCSAWDLAERKSSGLPTTGFSGTNDFRYLLPATITQHPLDHQRGTNARVLSHLLQQENDHYDSLAVGGNAEELLNAITNQSPEIRVLLDVGAQVLDLQNDEVAKRWLVLNQDAQAAIYFNRHDELVVRTRDHVIEPFSASSFSRQVDQCVLYLDDEHTRGTDVKLPQGFRAAVTLGPKVTKDRLVQGCMRMRKLGHDHSVMFFAPPEIDRSIRAVNNKHDNEDIHVSDILVWAMSETCSDIQHRSSQWLQHGKDYRSRHSAWSSFLSGDITPTQLAPSWLQPEAKHLEELYAQTLADTSASHTSLDEDLLERCSSLGLGISPDNRLDEEQEREVVHEIERESEVERPPPVLAAPHSIDEDVRFFIRTGTIPDGSHAFTAIFDTLTPTSAAFSERQPWSRDVFASRDFATTVLTEEKTDSYTRPVNWILSSTASPGAQVLVIISPFEVNVLLPDIRASKRVHLHAYTPRVIKMMKSCDDLRLYITPSIPARWMPDDALIRQLNVFAGQLYFPHQRAYVKLCRLLGIYTADLKYQGTFEIQSDGFIKPEHRPRAANSLDTFQQSPIPMLKALFGIRRKGMGYLPTHIGKLLSARRLTGEDFEDTV